ncbi:MAG: DUF4136 domain-containing protein [Ferruginibacter sp.]
MKNFLLLSLITMLLSSCGPTLQVFSDYDKALNMSVYKNYNWLDLQAIESRGMNPLYYNELNDQRIKRAVDKQMQARNYSTASKNEGLQIHYHIIVENKTNVITEPVGAQYRPYSSGSRTTTYQYREGTLIIDLMDTKTNTLIWRGWATDVITNSVKKDPEAAIQNAVAKIFEVFPAGNH